MYTSSQAALKSTKAMSWKTMEKIYGEKKKEKYIEDKYLLYHPLFLCEKSASHPAKSGNTK